MSNRRVEILVVALAGLLTPVAQAQQTQQSWALDAAKIYLAPDTPAVTGQVVIAGAKIQSVAPASGKRAVAATRAPQCNAGVVVAGFQNSHVHFTGDEFRDARHQRAETLDVALTRMLTRYGYTTVFDIASDRDNTLALRHRIETGEVRGPRILTAGWALFPPHGLPIYISHMRKELLDKLPQPSSIDEALKVVRENFAAGADGTKLFLVTPQGDNAVKRMPPDIARAAVDETHRRAKLVFAHPTDIQGIQEALDAHVDILAHPPLGAPVPWPEPLMKQVRDAGMSMIPTLKLFEFELAKEHVPASTAERLVNESVTGFGQLCGNGWAGAVRHRCGLHDRLRSGSRVRADGKRRLDAHADPRIADHDTCCAMERAESTRQHCRWNGRGHCRAECGSCGIAAQFCRSPLRHSRRRSYLRTGMTPRLRRVVTATRVRCRRQRTSSRSADRTQTPHADAAEIA